MDKVLSTLEQRIGMDAKAKAETGDGTVGKAVEVLELVASFGRPVRFSAVLARSRHPKATLYRHLRTLVAQGLLAFDEEAQTYAPGIRLVRLAHAAWRQSSLAPIARDHLDALSAELGATVHLAQLDHAQVLYVDKRNAREPIEMFSQAGKVGPAYCTGVGKAMLAFVDARSQPELIAQQSFHRFTERTITNAEALAAELARIRARGFALDEEEHEPGIICAAVPILTRSGRLLGALSVTSATALTTLADLRARVPRLQAAAQAIAREMESWRFPEEAGLPNGLPNERGE